MWPFTRKPRVVSRQPEIDALKNAVSGDRYELYRNLVKLDDATKRIETSGVRVMLGDMFRQIDEAKRRD